MSSPLQLVVIVTSPTAIPFIFPNSSSVIMSCWFWLSILSSHWSVTFSPLSRISNLSSFPSRILNASVYTAGWCGTTTVISAS